MAYKLKILVTGGAGNIGSALVKKLISNKFHFVVVIDDLSTGSIDKLPKLEEENFKFVKANVNNLSEIDSVFYSFNFDFVFHLAAVVGVIRTQENPIKVLKDIDGIKNILELSKNSSVKQVFYSSSSEVYGEPVELPQNEHRTPLNSRVPYAVVKNLGECFFRSYQQEYGLTYTIFRFFNTYGPGQSTDFVTAKFIAAALKGEDIPLYGDGSQTRTFTYIDDNIETISNIFEKGLVKNDVINLGNDELTSIKELAQLIIKLTDSKSKIIHLPPLKEGDMTRRQPDNSKMKTILNKKLISIEEGIKKILADKQFLKSIGM
ncbi:MAG: GDP-mannose 4,6-dehydratase [Bacteroidota bacterium]|nr:GDP-mannose 4,6-dehydratase [Bacteroidota bacterium]